MISIVLGLFFEGFKMTITPYSVFSILFTAILCSALAYWVQMEMQKHTTPTHAALIFLGEPVFTAIIAAIFLKEVMTASMIIGSILILAGMVVSEFVH
jgi:drug/metabolite transporter (DMT)-like permease